MSLTMIAEPTIDGETSVIVRSRDNDGQAPYALALLDANGTEVEEVKTEMYWNPEFETNIVADTLWNTLLADLHTVARRSALNIDKIVNSLLGELADDNEPF